MLYPYTGWFILLLLLLILLISFLDLSHFDIDFVYDVIELALYVQRASYNTDMKNRTRDSIFIIIVPKNNMVLEVS